MAPAPAAASRYIASCLAHQALNKIAEAEAAVSVNEKKWLVMHVHVQLKLDELRGPPNPWHTSTAEQAVPYWRLIGYLETCVLQVGQVLESA
jgi:hypothetical protein